MTTRAPADSPPALPPGVRVARTLRRVARRSGLHPILKRARINRLAERALLRRYTTRPTARLDLRVGGFDLVVPGPTVRWYLHDRYEPLTLGWIERTVQAGWRAIDVGASIGYLSLALSRAVGPEGTVVACEPVAETADLLAENVSRNSALNVTIVRAAVGASDGRRVMHLTAAGDLDGFYGNPRGQTIDQRAVDVTTIDAIADGVVDFVKIDVEGAELDVLDGMRATLPSVRALVVEWNPGCLAAAGADPRDLPRRLIDAGFDVQVLDEGAGKARLVSDVLADLEANRLGALWYGNLVATR